MMVRLAMAMLPSQSMVLMPMRNWCGGCARLGIEQYDEGEE